MTLDAFLEARDATARADEEVLGGNVVSLPTAPHAGSVPTSVRRMLEVQGRLMVPILVGVATAVLVGADVAASIGVLATWVLVHLNIDGARLRSGVPDRSSLTRHIAVPFAFVALAVAVGMLPASTLKSALLISATTTGALLLTALVMRSRRRPTRVVVVGEREHLGRAATSWSKRRDVAIVGASLLGDEDGAEHDLFESFGLPTSQGIDDLAERVERSGADMVVVLPSPAIGASDIRRISWALEDTGATLAVKTDLDSVSAHRLAMSSVADCAVAEIGSSRAPFHVRGLKSLIDRAGGALLLVLFAPLLFAMVAAVRLESRGPGLFTQIRVGQNGRPFKVYKMRTMCIDAEERKESLGDEDEGNGVLFKMRQDPRITRVGGLLRKTSLDELPQLINVVKGEMSLVGPRPALPDEVAQYDETARRRLAVRPGMTGLWQVSGRSDLDWDTTVALDVRYTDNVTISEDLRICLRTVRAVTSGKGAY